MGNVPTSSEDLEAPVNANVSPLPDDALIILPVRNTVMFPGMVLPLTIGRRKSIAAAQEAARRERPLGVIMQRDAMIEAPAENDLHRIGTVATVLRYVTAPDGSHHVICQGQSRFRIVDFLPGYPFFAARVEYVPEPESTSDAIEARMLRLRREAAEALKLSPQAPAELSAAIEAAETPSTLADIIASFIDLKPDEKQEILELIEVRARLDKVSERLAHRIAVLRLSQELDQQTTAAMNKNQREFMLREQLKTIQRELGEIEPRTTEIEELREAIAKAGMPSEADEQAKKELARLEHMPDASVDYSMARTYLDWMVSLPWSVLSDETIDIAAARGVLDADHYGLEKIKRRILEFLAVRKLAPGGKAPILCFVGPPGVGKTSLGQSIARSTGRKFMRISLGGVHDEAEIRGHRRTYVGALPGNIIQHIRRAGTRNPVCMLDEVDKLGAGFHGDPAAALLEVLDPEQNATFRDNYLAVPFDLSRVMFICTANMLDTIPGPLRDRMEIIELPGYTDEEKVEIARRYLVQRQLETNGLKSGQCDITTDALRAIVRDYTREAGCRNLEREIGRVFRHVAMQVAEDKPAQSRIDVGDLTDILGAQKFEAEVAARTALPGVATGLAWTPVGGDILFIEAARVPGKGGLMLTGQLGDVMKESVQAALSLVKSRARELEVPADSFEKNDIHVHVPAGAIPKDGPSAGVAMFVALVSLLTGKTVNPETAMTGEISLRGLVLPVGGIKDKCLAAARAGLRTVCLPARNRRDFEDIPESARKQLKFVWLETVDDALRAALR